jgi:uncharacterized membrane protein
MKNQKPKTIGYWISTGLLSLGMLAGGIGQLMQEKFNVIGVTHLGYPVYILFILGTWKLLGVVAILAPNLKLIKEWAYAGFFFLLTGAVISHIVSGDKVVEYIAPFIFACLVVTSWYMRPDNRKLNFGNVTG